MKVASKDRVGELSLNRVNRELDNLPRYLLHTQAEFTEQA